MPYSQQQLENALRKAQAAGDNGAAQIIANELRQLKGSAAPRAETAPGQTWGEYLGSGALAGAKGFGKGMLGDVVGAAQIGADVFPGTAEGVKMAFPGVRKLAREAKDISRSQDKEWPTVSEIGRTIGAAAPIAAVAPLTGGGSLFDATAVGGLTGLLQPTPGGDWATDIWSHGLNAGIGELFGGSTALGGLAMQKMAPAAGWLARNVPPYAIGHLVHHPIIAWHLLRNTPLFKLAQQAAAGTMRGTGKALEGIAPEMAAHGPQEAEPRAGDPNDPMGYLQYGQ